MKKNGPCGVDFSKYDNDHRVRAFDVKSTNAYLGKEHTYLGLEYKLTSTATYQDMFTICLMVVKDYNNVF